MQVNFTQSEQVAHPPASPPQEPQVQHQTPVLQSPATGQEVMVLASSLTKKWNNFSSAIFGVKEGPYNFYYCLHEEKALLCNWKGPGLSFSRHKLATHWEPDTDFQMLFTPANALRRPCLLLHFPLADITASLSRGQGIRIYINSCQKESFAHTSIETLSRHLLPDYMLSLKLKTPWPPKAW